MSIAAERLRENETLYMKGNLAYSRLSAQIKGAELERRVAQAKARGQRYPTAKPHTTISIINPVVLPADPNNPTLEEQYLAEKIFTLKSGDNAGKKSFSVDNISNSLPQVFAPNAEGKHEQVMLTGDLDSGLEVILAIRTFKSPQYEKRGLSLDKVFVQEPLRYYQSAGGIDTAALAALGITIEGPVTRVSTADAPEVVNTQPDPDQEPVAELPRPQAEPAPVAQQPAQAQASDDGLDELERQLAELRQKKAAEAAQAQIPAPAPQGQSAFDQGTVSPWEAGSGEPGIGFGS